MPWHTELYAKASEAAVILNALPFATSLHPDYVPPTYVPRIRYRFAYCVFADSIEDAEDCLSSGTNCPADYMLAGITKTIDEDSPEERAYFRLLWKELDVAMHGLEDEGVTPKPISMLSGIYSGNLRIVGQIPDKLIGLAATIGNINAHIVTGGMGASTIEAQHVNRVSIAHELGHLLGLSHTTADAFFGVDGFMRAETPAPSYAILGPSLDPADGYEVSNQWANWIDKIGEKTIPRPSAFDLAGCNDDNDCPPSLSCWDAGPSGFCRPE